MIICFIGHRTIDNHEQVKSKLFDTLSTLILNGADTFLFGSKSEFDALCWAVVTELKEQYSHIKRIVYLAPHETAFTSKKERERYEQLLSQIGKRNACFADYEEAVTSQKSLKSRKNSYIMRNQEMIDNSDICVFYFNKDYLPPMQKHSNKYLPDHRPESGTARAFAYATQKKKDICNIFLLI